MRSFSFLAGVLLLISGCAHKVFSPEALALVDPTISFAMLKENPEKYSGRHVLLGGAIAKAKNVGEGGELEVVEFKVTQDGRPEEAAVSGGRFIAQSKAFLDPLIFKPGLMVSLVGEVKGKSTMPLDGSEYTYPIVAVNELYLWKPEPMYRATPAFSFGLGVFHGF